MRLFREFYLIPVYLYRGILSPFKGPSCRYVPSCSGYFIEAVRKFGIVKGSIMGIARLGRCRNAFLGGPDPVPDTWSWEEVKNEYRIRRKPKGFDKSFKNKHT